MADFAADATLRVPGEEIQRAKREIEDDLVVDVGVQPSQRVGRTQGPSGGVGAAGAAAGGGIVGLAEDRNDLLEDVVDLLESDAGGGGGGGGGGLLKGFGLARLAGVGGTGLGAGSLLGGVGLGGLGTAGAMAAAPVAGSALLLDYLQSEEPGPVQTVGEGAGMGGEGVDSSSINWAGMPGATGVLTPTVQPEVEMTPELRSLFETEEHRFKVLAEVETVSVSGEGTNASGGSGGPQQYVPGSGGNARAPFTRIPGLVGGGGTNASSGGGGPPPATPGSGGRRAGPVGASATGRNQAQDRSDRRGGSSEIRVQNDVTIRDRRDLDRKLEQMRRDLKQELEQDLSGSGSGFSRY